jgi:hypothetical protein
MAGRGQAGDIDDVLDTDRHAVQGPARAAGGDLGLGGERGLKGGLAIDADEGVQLGVEPRDAIEQRLRQLDGREFAVGDGARRLGDRQPMQAGRGAGGIDVHSPSPGRIGGQGSRADRPAP